MTRRKQVEGAGSKRRTFMKSKLTLAFTVLMLTLALAAAPRRASAAVDSYLTIDGVPDESGSGSNSGSHSSSIWGYIVHFFS
jgi:hypothetical protein